MAAIMKFTLTNQSHRTHYPHLVAESRCIKLLKGCHQANYLYYDKKDFREHIKEYTLKQITEKRLRIKQGMGEMERISP